MVQKILLGIIVVIVAFFVIGFLLPGQWAVEKGITINAPPENIYPFVANLKNGWPQWSEFDFQDPDIQYSYSGPEEGEGASRSWKSKKAGVGTQKIVKANPSTGVQFELVMEEGRFLLYGDITFTPQNNGTHVTWKDHGDVGANPVMRYMMLFIEKITGPTLEKSLENLKTKVESAQK